MTSRLSVIAENNKVVPFPLPNSPYSNAPSQSDYPFKQISQCVTADSPHTVFDVPTPTFSPPARSSPERWNECARAIHALLKSAGVENWDGEGGLALSESTVDRAVTFLSTCPAEAFFVEIDFAADATGDGDVMLTWAVGYDRLLTVLITEDRQVLHSGVFPAPERERTGVSDWIDRGQLPEGIAPCFDRLAAAIP